MLPETAVIAYGEKEVNYLKSRDKALAQAIDEIGMIRRATSPDLFSSLVNNIAGQQISGKGLETIWRRLLDKVGEMTPAALCALPVEEIQSCGMSMRKAGYIKNAAALIHCGEFNLEELAKLPDNEVCKQLSSLNGIGEWTAEMLMLFSMQRPDILSFGDLAIHRGLRMLYHHRKIDRKLFEKYRRRYSPYGSVASLYLWEIASGSHPQYKDYAPKPKKK